MHTFTYQRTLLLLLVTLLMLVFKIIESLCYILNNDQKRISKSLAATLKEVFPFLIGPGKTAYVNARFLGENGILIAGIIETCDLKQLERYLVAIDFERAFDSLNHNCLISALEQ